MPNNNYWDDRFEQLNKKQFKKGDEFIKDLEKQYRKAALKIEKDIDHWFNRLAKNNGISRAEAELLLNADELEEFQWTVEEYIARGMENSINQKYMKELENASAKVHISRLEALLIQMKQHIAEVMDYEDKGLKEVASDVYTEGYYKSSYEIQKRLGVGKELSKLNTEKVEKIISKPWAKDGKNFSKRIWGDHRKELNSMLEEGLTQIITGGGTKDELINKLKGLVSKDIKDAKNAAERLVNSELAFINSSSNYDSYIENGVEKYKIVAALELGSGRRTCEKCAAKDGKVYDIEDWEVGKTAPLFHPRCRCTTSPKMDNAITRNAKRTRAAKIDGGKTEHIENMSFSEWEKRYVKDKELANSAESGIIKNEEQKFLESKIKDGSITLNINPTMQQKHMEATRMSGKSYFTISTEELQEIINNKYGTGKIIIKNGQIREIIEYNKDIAVNVDFKTGAETSTNRFTIHYSKTRTHAVPTIRRS